MVQVGFVPTGELSSVNKHVPLAPFTHQSDVCSGAHNHPAINPTGMLLSKRYYIAYLYRYHRKCHIGSILVFTQIRT